MCIYGPCIKVGLRAVICKYAYMAHIWAVFMGRVKAHICFTVWRKYGVPCIWSAIKGPYIWFAFRVYIYSAVYMVYD